MRSAAPSPTPKISFLQGYHEPEKESPQSYTGYLLDFIVVLGIAYVSIWGLRRLSGMSPKLPGRRTYMRLLESVSLGPNRSVHIVRVGPKLLVLGATADQITVLSEVEDPDFGVEAPVSSPDDFSRQLSRSLEDPETTEIREQLRQGVRHIWERVEEVRGLGHPRGGPR